MALAKQKRTSDLRQEEVHLSPALFNALHLVNFARDISNVSEIG